MSRRLGHATLLVVALALGARRSRAQSPAETRVLIYLQHHVKPGRPLRVTDLYNRVFTRPDERQALDKLYKAFFRMPLFIARYQDQFHHPPSLRTLAQQFALGNPAAARVLLQVMVSDPRVPHFIETQPGTGEISRVDTKAIEGDPAFSQGAARRLGGWKGEPAPAFSLDLVGGGHLNSDSLRGRVVLLYIWFTGCPPCMKEAPAIERLQQEFAARGFESVGANADAVLGLATTTAARERYIRKERLTFPIAVWSPESDRAYGSISIFPTLFLMDRQGIVRGHWVGYTPSSELRAAIWRTLGPS